MDRAGLSIEIDRTDDAAVIRLTGELDLASAPDLRGCIDDLPLDGEVILDLSGLSFLDSTGIGCLFRMQQRAEDLGGMLVARGAPTMIRHAMQTAQLSRVIAVVD
jgi:anti-anti-sigma factor